MIEEHVCRTTRVKEDIKTFRICLKDVLYFKKIVSSKIKKKGLREIIRKKKLGNEIL